MSSASVHHKTLLDKKNTVAPNICFKRKVNNRFVKFCINELKQQVKDAIMPMRSPTKDISTLIMGVLNKSKLLQKEPQKSTEKGCTGWCHRMVERNLR